MDEFPTFKAAATRYRRQAGAAAPDTRIAELLRMIADEYELQALRALGWSEPVVGHLE